MKSQLSLFLYYLRLGTQTPLIGGWQQLLCPHQTINKSYCHNVFYEPRGLKTGMVMKLGRSRKQEAEYFQYADFINIIPCIPSP